MSKSGVFRVLRISALLLILFLILLNSWLSQTRFSNWRQTLQVVIYPVNGDGRQATQAYIDALLPEHFEDIERFFSEQSRRYALNANPPVEVSLAGPVTADMPDIPQNGSIAGSLWWSVKMRWWAWFYDNWEDDKDVQIYMRFFTPEASQILAHTLGAQKGMIGVVNGFVGIDYQGRNNIVAAHELLHTLGATDKYHLSDNMPIWPGGFANPTQLPLFPQAKAEIMAGRVPVSEGWALMPQSLEDVVVGAQTAIEINWIAVPD